MPSTMLDPIKYDFSFTGSSLRLQEMILVAKAIFEKRDLDITNELGKGKSSTGKRMYAEFLKRISLLSPTQLELLAQGNLNLQKQMAFLSVCKSYGFIRDFVVEVLREKVLLFDYEILEGNYISFYRNKKELHPEMETLTEISQQKIRQVTFKILEQAGIIDTIRKRNLQPQLLEPIAIKAIIRDNPDWLQLFFMGDMEIATIISNQ